MRIMRVAAAILFIIVLVLAWRLKTVTTVVSDQAHLLTQQQHQILTLQRDLDNKSVQVALNLQIQCSEVASKFVTSRGWKISDPNVTYKNHFNSKQKKCFVLISDYSTKDDFLAIDLYDAVEGSRYATFNGHQICDIVITGNPKKCALDSGHIWFDGNDTRNPADLVVGFRGLLYGGGSGDEKTLKAFLDNIKPFMSE